MTVSKTPTIAAIDGRHPEGSSPRNVWARVAAAIDHLQSGDVLALEKDLDSVSMHDRLPRELLLRLRRELVARAVADGHLALVNTPANYLVLPYGKALHPFRRLSETGQHVSRFPRGMILPVIPGMGNDTDFLVDAANGRLEADSAPVRRVHAVISSATTQAAREILSSLAEQMGDRPFSATVFMPSNQGPIDPLPGIPMEQVGSTLLERAATEHLERLALRSIDVLLFLEGGVILDASFMRRALFLADCTDNLVQVLQPAVRHDELRTTFSSYAENDLRKHPAPYDRIQSFNLVVPARLLHRVGGIEKRFESSDLAARELGYRMHLQGAYFHSIAVPQMAIASVAPASDGDRALFDSLCPRPGVPREARVHERPRVSVYVPAYNAERFIVETVESVLSQDIPDIEVCLFEDGSTDATLKVLEGRFGGDDRVFWSSGRNGGIGRASNHAVRMTRAPYVAQLDADDVLKPGAIRLLMEHLDRYPHIACCYGSCERISDKGNVIRPEYSWPEFTREKMMMTSIVHHLRMFRRSAWERTTGFREDLLNAVDYDMFLKLSEVGPMQHIDEKIYQRRWHGRNTSLVNEQTQTKNTWRVQRAALERVSLARDWQVHVPNPAEPRKITYKRRPNRRCVVFWPDYSRSNPYQKLLYRSARDSFDIVGGTIESALSIMGEFEFKSMVTFHLHWLNFVLLNATNREEAESMAGDFIDKLKVFKALGGKVVWTVHNAVSHESMFEDIELRLSEEVADVADVLHLHSSSSVEEVACNFAFQREKVVVSRHGSFVGVYPDLIDRHSARQELGLAPDADVLLFLGQIRNYKGIDHLVDAFREVGRDRQNAVLLIAGQDKSGLLPSLLKRLSKEERARVFTAARRIGDFEMQIFFRASDLAILPYKRILTSGSLLLAMSFGVPAVVPDVGMCREVMGARKAGFLFPPDSGVSGLVQAIEEGLSLKDSSALEEVSRSARARAERLTWPNVARVLEAWRTS